MSAITPFSAAGPIPVDRATLTSAPAVAVDCGCHRVLYLSGQVAPTLGDGGRGDVETQIRASLDQVRDLITAAGGQMKDIAKFMAFMPRREDFAVYKRVRSEYVTHLAASSTIVTELGNADALIELEAIVIIRNPERPGGPEEKRALSPTP